MTAPLTAVDRFIGEVRKVAPAEADGIGQALDMIFAGVAPKCVELSDSIRWILREPRTTAEKLSAIARLIRWDMAAPIGTSISMRKLTGW